MSNEVKQYFKNYNIFICLCMCPMTRDQIEQLQAKLKQYYPQLNRWWCWLFAYAFVSRIGWEWLRLAHGKRDAEINNWNIDKHLSSEHFVVQYDGMVFDWHEFWNITWEKVWNLSISDSWGKDKLLLAVFEWWWNPTFYKSKIGNNNWDVLWTFLSDFESMLDQIGVKYSSRIS